MGLWHTAIATLMLAAQAQTVSVTGTVRDAESGMPLAQAVISVGDPRHTVRTDDLGRYSFDTEPGTRHMVVQRFGYATQSFDALVPREGALEIDVAMRREPILLSPIEVRAPVAIRGFDESARRVEFPDRRMSQAALYDHPLSSEPDALRAIGGGEVTLDPEAPSGLHIRGGASDQVAYLLDGIPVLSPYHSAGTFGAWNPDALASVDVIAASPLHTAPEALSGVVTANTRAPGSRLHTRGSVSATQARMSLDGPFGPTGAGFLASVGSAFPGLVMHKNEASHLDGNNFDWLGKLESPLLGGRMRVLGYGSRNDIDASAVAEGDTATSEFRNTLGWDGQSFGGEWTRPLGEHALFTMRAWSATGNANTSWMGVDSLEYLSSSRRDDGGVATIDAAASGGRTTIGARVQRVESAYSLQPTATGGRAAEYSDENILTTLFVEHERPLAKSLDVELALANTLAMGENHLSPSAQLRWRATPAWFVSTTATRRHQFGQSLRNPESVVSNVFPADLFVEAGESGIPVATSNLGIVAVEHRPNEWLRFGVQAYARDFESIALVAPRTADPYATNGFVVGAGESYGLSLEAGASRTHYGLLATYTYQHVDFRYPGENYTPNYGASHLFQAGVVLSPAASTTFRVGFEGVVGRRTTAATGSFEWEACNMLDGGCEFAGTPSEWSGGLGGTGLPTYLRLDFGVRKQWDVRLGARDGSVALFGTATNLLARRNVLTVSVDPSTGARHNVDMMPPSPLVVGIDWRF